MLLFFAFQSSLPWEDGFSQAGFFHPRHWKQAVSRRLLAAARSSLTGVEELLSKGAPIIGFCFPASVPVIFALIFACVNLTSRIRS
jgi:hypothetical protein